MIVFTITNKKPIYFALSSDKIVMQNESLKTFLKLEDFKKLFSTSTFYIYEPDVLENEIDISRDIEYYSWKHK